MGTRSIGPNSNRSLERCRDRCGFTFLYSLALRADGTVVAWGLSSEVAALPAGISNVVRIAAGWTTSLALQADGHVVAWSSSNANGEANVPLGLANVVAIVCGDRHNLALVGSGPPVTSAVANNAGVDASGFHVSVPSQSGRVYRLEYKNAFGEPNWTPLPLVAGNGGNWYFLILIRVQTSAITGCGVGEEFEEGADFADSFQRICAICGPHRVGQDRALKSAWILGENALKTPVNFP